MTYRDLFDPGLFGDDQTGVFGHDQLLPSNHSSNLLRVSLISVRGTWAVTAPVLYPQQWFAVLFGGNQT